MQIKKAQRSAVKIKLAVTGPSGSGKTLGSLLLGKGLCGDGKMLVIDSEDGSSNLYADHKMTVGIDYDVLEINAPYTTQKYIEALELGQKEGYDLIIIDSISHAWAGEGGILDKKNAIDMRGGNSFTNWGKVTKDHEAFKSTIVHAKCHVIVTMRSKQDYIMEANDRGKQAPRKVGLAPVQREGMEYEFTTVFDCGMDHSYVVSKDRTGLFDGRMEKLSLETGKELREWLGGASKDEAQVVVDATPKDYTPILNEIVTGFCSPNNDKWAIVKPILADLVGLEKGAIFVKLDRNIQNWIREMVEKDKAASSE